MILHMEICIFSTQVVAEVRNSTELTNIKDLTIADLELKLI